MNNNNDLLKEILRLEKISKQDIEENQDDDLVVNFNKGALWAFNIVKNCLEIINKGKE